MAFKLTKSRIVEWPVSILVPVDGGNVSEQTCTATFDIIPMGEYNKIMNDDLVFLNRVVVGFGADVQAEDGSALECTAKNKTALFESAGFVRAGFITAWHDAHAGIASKNFKGPRATGRTAPK